VAATLAIAIGSATAAFALVNAAFASTESVRDPGRLVVLQGVDRSDSSGTPADVPWDTQALLRQEQIVFVDVAAIQSGAPYPFASRYGDRILQFTSTLVSSNFFQMLGVRASCM
jgi:hypothetical protein